MAVKKVGRTTTPKTSDKQTCILQVSEKCKKKHGQNVKSNFYQKISNTFIGEKVHICKDCMKEYVYQGEKFANKERFKDVCRWIDIPFIEELWDSSFADRKETIGIYMKNVAFNWIGKTWRDSDYPDEISKNYNTKEVYVEDENVYDYVKLRKEWGRFSNEELEFLADRFREWDEKTTINTLPLERIVKRLCIKELRIQQTEENGDDTGKLEAGYITLMDKADLTPKNKKEDKTGSDEKWLGEKIMLIETKEPAEYYKDKKMYEDFDSLWEYMKTLIYRPLKNLLTKERDFTGKYSIDEEDKLDEV